jgi:hypothetical protein
MQRAFSGSTACKLKRAARRNILRNDVDGMPPTFARGARWEVYGMPR